MYDLDLNLNVLSGSMYGAGGIGKIGYPKIKLIKLKFASFISCRDIIDNNRLIEIYFECH